MTTLADHLPAGQITWLEGSDKEGALRTLLRLVAASKAVRDPAAVERAILSREVMMSTGIGYGIAVPHAHVADLEEFVLALGISRDGITYKSEIDDKPVRLIFMIVGPERDRAGYLKLLANLMRFIKSEKGKILSSTSAEEIRRFAAAYPMNLDSPRTSESA